MSNHTKTAYVAYRRVSTEKQGRSGLGLSAQESAIAHFVKASGATVVATYTDIESGTIDDRAQLLAAIDHARRSNARLVVATLDRLSRDVAYLATLMKQVDFVAADMPSASTFELHIRAAIAQEERRKISERTKAALAAARARGTVLGGYRGIAPSAAARAKAIDARTNAATARARCLAPIIAELRADGCNTLAALANGLNARGVTAPRGGMWTAMQVQRIEKRASLA